MNLEKMFQDVFHVEAGERVVVLTDHPHGDLRDSTAWQERRQMASEWRDTFAGLGRRLGFEVRPLVGYPATGRHNGDLPLATVIERNRIVDVRGPEPVAAPWRTFFAEDRARANIAEFAFGCNPRAVVWGNVLEDEKAGFHWAYGRSEFLGGTVSASSFRSPDHVLHEDIVYAKGSPIELQSVHLNRPDGSRPQIIGDGDYLVF